jgi:hypothetical protein
MDMHIDMDKQHGGGREVADLQMLLGERKERDLERKGERRTEK